MFPPEEAGGAQAGSPEAREEDEAEETEAYPAWTQTKHFSNERMRIMQFNVK